MGIFTRSSSFSRVTSLASLRPVHAAFSWLHMNPKRIMDWQAELVAIPAPPFGEDARSGWLAERFRAAGLREVTIDEVGNVIGRLQPATLPEESTGPVVVVSAHLDTVFPAHTLINVVREDDRLLAPGACDNGAGIVGMLAIAHAMIESKIELAVPIVFLGNVGEEGEGDLRGVRHFYANQSLAGRIAAHIVLDGAGADAAVTQALGSRRFQVTISGPGGHSFTDAGTANPIVALAAAIAEFAAVQIPEEPRTTLSVGTISGGTSVNSIPESATATVDMRSTDTSQILRLEVALHRAVEDAVSNWNGKAKPGMSQIQSQTQRPLTFRISKIGDRPAGVLPDDSPMLEALRAVDRHLRLRTDLRLGSTDANIPLSLGVPALSMGAGGEGGGAHTQAEWYSAKDREMGLRRVLLFALAIAEWAAEQ